MHEMDVMKQLAGNEHILRLIGYAALGDTPVLVLEYCASDSLFSYLRHNLADCKDAISYVGPAARCKTRLAALGPTGSSEYFVQEHSDDFERPSIVCVANQRRHGKVRWPVVSDIQTGFVGVKLKQGKQI